MKTSVLLQQPRLSLIARETEGELCRIRDVVSETVAVEGRADVEDVLNCLARDCVRPMSRSLDLIGHSTPDRSLLVLGDWVIDGASSKVASFFRGLADCEVFARLGVHSIRLLGCETATTEAGRHTLVRLAEILEIEVSGTTRMIDAGSYDAAGFRDDHLLLSATDVRETPLPMAYVKPGGEPYRRVLDIDGLPASPLGALPNYPRRLASLDAARKILALVRRAEGAQMPGFSVPMVELALPSGKPGWSHRVQLLANGEFVRVYPDGEDRPGVVFPVEDPKALCAILAELPLG